MTAKDEKGAETSFIMGGGQEELVKLGICKLMGCTYCRGIGGYE